MMLTRMNYFPLCTCVNDDKRREKTNHMHIYFLRAFHIKSLDMITSTSRRESCEHTIDKSCNQKETCSSVFRLNDS